MGDSSRSKELPARDAELSVELLRRSYPEVLSRWVLVGIFAAMLGYAISSLSVYLEYSAHELFRRLDLWALGCALVALGLHRRGKVRAAGALVLGPVWLEQHVTLATMPQHLWAAPSAVLPLLVLLTGVWLGARAALRLGVATMLSVPAAVIASGVAGFGPGLSGE